MEPQRAGRPSFTLRFEDQATHEALRLIARELDMSMNRLAEELIARELRVMALGLEMELSETLEALRAYRGEGLEQDLAGFAQAEVEQEDPVRTRLAEFGADDPLGIASLFA
jgi:hypothetical protein